MILVNDFQRLTIITKRSILDVAAALDRPLKQHLFRIYLEFICLEFPFSIYLFYSRNAKKTQIEQRIPHGFFTLSEKKRTNKA